MAKNPQSKHKRRCVAKHTGSDPTEPALEWDPTPGTPTTQSHRKRLPEPPPTGS